MRDFARLLLLAVALPVLAIAALLTWQGRSTARAHFDTQLAVAADMTARDVETFVEMHRAALQVLAERSTREENLGDSASWLREFERVHGVYPAFDRLVVMDAQGRVVATRPSLTLGRDDPFAADFVDARANRRPFLSNVHHPSASRAFPTVTIAAPLYAHDRFAGVVAGAIRIDAFPILRASAQLRGFELVLLDGTDTVVRATLGVAARAGESLRGTPGVYKLHTLASARGGAKMAKLSGLLRDGGKAFGVRVPLESGWDLAVLVPERALLGELRHDALLLLGLLGVVLCGVLAIVWFLMRRMGRSVRDLLHRIQHFTLENPPTAEEFASIPPELAPLAEAMRQFSTRCHDAYEKVNVGLQEQRCLREELERMARRLLTVQEDERRTLSRELHDDIGQAITAIKLGAMALQDDEDPADARGAARSREILGEIIATTDQTIAKLRNLSMLLRPPQLDTLGLETALRWQAERLFRSGKPQLEIAIAPLPRRPSPEVELACFRIAQEALTNVVRHSGARRVALSLGPDAGGTALRLEITDDGRGFVPGDRSGLGLVTMRERAHQVGGTLDITCDTGLGVRVQAVLPPQDANHVAVPESRAQESVEAGRNRGQRPD